MAGNWRAPVKIFRQVVTLFAAAGILFHAPQKSVFAAPKSDIVMPAVSLILPGLDQWIEGDYGAAAAYSGIWLGGGLLASEANRSMKDRGLDPNDKTGFSARDGDVRRLMLGNQLAMAAGSFSTLHAFRNAADSRRELGQYSFLGEKVTVPDLALAPFRFEYLGRPTTYIPLGIISALALVSVNTKSEKYENVAIKPVDTAFAGSFAYLAGTNEEALFRGWMMPVLREYVAGDIGANILQSLVFALAHRSQVEVPITQLLLGYHWGYVTQRNGWFLGEAAFTHAWWDVVAFLAIYSKREIDSSAMIHGRAGGGKKDPGAREMPVLRLPPVTFNF